MKIIAPYKNDKWQMLEQEIEPEIDKYDTHKNSVFQKWHTLRKNAERLLSMDWAEWFLKMNS